MAKLNKEQSAALAALRDRVVLTVRFISDADAGFQKMAEELVQGAESAFAQNDLRALRLLADDVDKLPVALVSHQRGGLEALLKARLGVDKEDERASRRSAVAAVLSKGRIESEKQRRKLEDYLEMLEATGGDLKEITAVRDLLADC